MVFLSCFQHFSEQGSRRAEIISEIRAQLEACQRKQKFDVKFEISNRKNPRVLSFSLTSQTLLDQSVDFDVLPAFDALGEVPRHKLEMGKNAGRVVSGGPRDCVTSHTSIHVTGMRDTQIYHNSPTVCGEAHY